ncbi:unnamed protein product [Pseudo-nitzschia multistriata]|uniref:Protein kinase domain-containing protein n=1 Tax=Pseudo-nitzschia multistriata TaxID=183589 RepID=A0A448Z613_9STRA|nr:unnamed protein product [Pseudo-nitzschia multistriata]
MIVPFPPIVVEAALTASLLLNPMAADPIPPPMVQTQTKNYEFGNGSVRIDNRMKFPGMTLEEPRFLGAGGGGSVWGMKRILDPGLDRSGDGNGNPGGVPKNVVVKISWLRSTDSVRNECDVLSVMEQRGVTGVERCLGSVEYPYDSRRVAIAMEPLMEDDGDATTSSLDDLTPELALRSALQLGKTMAQMIAAGVVTTDLQPLVSRSTGEVLLIDMTEARVLALAESGDIAEGDKLLIDAFCTEVLGLIPDSLLDDASESFVAELHRLEAKPGVRIDRRVKDRLRDLPITGVEKL